MELYGEKLELPAISNVSFFKIIEQLRKQAKDSDKNIAAFAVSLLK